MTASPKRVLIFSPAYFPFVGGAEVAIKEITDRISPETFEFHILTIRWDSNLPKTERIGNVIVHRMGWGKPGAQLPDLWHYPLAINKYTYQLTAPIVAASLHKQYRFDAVWAMMAHASGIPTGIFKYLHPNVPYLLTLQEGDPLDYLERIMKPVWPLFKQAFTSADIMQSISTFLEKWGKKMGFTGASQVVPNGVDIESFSKDFSENDLQSMREKLGKKPGDVFLVTTSRLVHKNAVDDVVRAMKLLPETISFLIYGSGPDEPMLHSLAQKDGVEQRVRFMGQTSHDELPLILHACDIFVRPSRSEGMGNSFVEAMAARLPVIATQEGGIADFLFDAKRNPEKPTTGWAVDKDAPDQIERAVNDILANPENARSVTAEAHQMVVERYNWNTIASTMQSLFERLTASAR